MKSHSFRGFTCLVGGIPIKSQFAKDQAVGIEYQEDQYTLVMGADGVGTTEDNNNRSAIITLRLLSSSDDNAKLSALHLIDGPDGKGITTFDLVDTKGTTVYHADEGRLVRMPNRQVGQKVDTVEWQYITDDLKSFVGGN